jgi:hypothetical protein
MIRLRILCAAALLAGCGSVERPASHARPRRPLARFDGCVRLGAGARTIVLRPAGATALTGVLVGTSPITVVLSDESDENLCSWLPFVGTLRAHGYSALLYDYLDPSELAADARAGAATALAAGARRVVLMGASVGARASIKAASSHPPGVVGVISLSAERTVASDRADLVGPARKLTIPTLLISAREDPYLSGDTAALLSALRAHRKSALVMPGSDHGTALLSGSSSARVRAAILSFLLRLG